MSMPVDLVLVRHGQAEHNLASKFSKQGDNSLFTDEFKTRPMSQHRLTDKGREQAKAAGEWLQKNGLARFDRRYVSDYVRAKETAALLGVDGPDWYVDYLLREREWGDFEGLSWEKRQQLLQDKDALLETDPFYWIPPNGESFAQMTVRLRHLFDTLHRECTDMRVVIVCHGEVMMALRQMLERLPIAKWAQLYQSEDPKDRIHNCQVLHYTRRDPDTGELHNHLDWVRSVCPWDETKSPNEWEKLLRRRFSDEQLLKFVNKTKPLFEGVDQAEDW